MRYLILISVLFSACATPNKPEKVPEVNSTSLPVTQIEILTPKVLHLTVLNTRSVNQKFNNSALVEQAVFSALRDSLSRGGIELDANSKNSLSVTTADCSEQEENTECAEFKADLATGRYKLHCEGHSSAILRSRNSTYNSSGDVSDVFQNGLKTIIGCFNKNSKPEQFKK